MFTARQRLFRLAGIPISIDWSWLIVVALATFLLTNQFRTLVPDLAPATYWLMGLATALAFFVCIVLHELGHAIVARRTGIPVRGITLFLFGGVAEMEREPPSPGKEFAMAIAGPVVTAVLAGLLWALFALGDGAGWSAPVLAVINRLFWINVIVLVFNMVPAFPLDGGRVFRSLVWAVTGSLRRSTWWASLLGRGFAWLLIGLGVFALFGGEVFGGIWFIIIGMFLNGIARNSYEQVVTRQALEGEPVHRFMNREPIVVSPTLTLREWVDDYVYRYHHKAYPVAPNGHAEGIISTDMLKDYPRAEWDRHTVGEVMRRDVASLTVSPETDGVRAMERMQRTGSSRLLVTDNGRLVGLLSIKDLLGFLQRKLELEGEEEEGDRRPPHVWHGAGRREGSHVPS